MWMRIKREMWRRGLGRGIFYSPSAALLWEKGTLFRPGKQLAFSIVFEGDVADYNKQVAKAIKNTKKLGKKV